MVTRICNVSFYLFDITTTCFERIRHISRNIEAIDIFEGVWEGRTTWSTFCFTLVDVVGNVSRIWKDSSYLFKYESYWRGFFVIRKETQIVKGNWPNLFVRSIWSKGEDGTKTRNNFLLLVPKSEATTEKKRNVVKEATKARQIKSQLNREEIVQESVKRKPRE